MKKIIIVLIIFVIALLGYITYDKIINNDIENNSITLNEEIKKIAGKYEYDGKTPGSYYYKLELLENGTYTYSYGMHNGGGYNAKGNYALSNNKIYLFNDNCNIAVMGNECVYPNCEKIIELSYNVENNKISIKVENIELENK